MRLAKVMPSKDVALEGGWEGARLRDRMRAAVMHLALSTAIVAAVLCVALSAWYPQPYFAAAGGPKLIGILLVVDLVLGPVLTLVAFDRRKRSLRADLATIAVLQALALGYGLHAAFHARPVFQVFVMDRFEIVSAAELEPAELALAPPGLRTLSRSGPKTVGAAMPDDGAERQSILFSAISGGADLRHFARHYRHFEQLAAQALNKSRPLDELNRYNAPQTVDLALQGAGRSPQTLRFLPIQGRQADLTALLDRASGAVVAVVNLKPWP